MNSPFITIEISTNIRREMEFPYQIDRELRKMHSLGSGLVTTTVLNTKTAEVENKMQDVGVLAKKTD